MAFWGTEVKPGRPVTHSFDRVRRRLRISQATLGFGSSTEKSILQCNIGVKAPVLLCTLLPDKTESFHLDIEFEEIEDVVFSVLGPRSIYLAGYYLLNCQEPILNDDTESYGEDIENTDGEESNHNGDESTYDNSFIDDDDDQEVFPSSSVFSDRVNTVAYNKKAKGSKGKGKRLRKKYRSVESDDGTSSEQKNIIKSSKKTPVGEGDENEDSEDIGDFFMPSSLLKERLGAKNMEVRSTEKAEDEVGKANKKAEDRGTHVLKSEGKSNVVLTEGDLDRKADVGYNSTLPCDEILYGRIESKRKKKKLLEDRSPEVDVVSNCNTFEERYSQDNKLANSMKHGVLLCGEQNQKQATDEKHSLSNDLLLSSTDMVHHNSTKAKKKRKTRSKTKGLGLETGTSCHNNTIKGDETQQAEEDTNIDQDFLMKNKDEKKEVTTMFKIEVDPNQLTGEIQFEKERKRKKKKKSKTHNDDQGVEMGVQSYTNSKSSHVRALSNGLIIEEIDKGEIDGKMAAPGKKVKIEYVGRLKDSGHLFDSNLDKAPLKFRLGDEGIIEGWNIGIAGMHIGARRKLIIPPSIGYGVGKGGENVPPDSWLVYDIKLLGIH